MKLSTSYFDRRIHVDQKGYLLTNFRLPFIQERDDSTEFGGGRPYKAEIRWYGASDEGLIDIRGEIGLWGTQFEICRWNKLCNAPTNAESSDIDVSELVLMEDWSSKLRKEHTARLQILHTVTA